MPTIITRGAASALAYGWSRIMAVVPTTDAFFKYVTMLLPGNGTNGAQNNTFLDSSTNNFTITRNGNTTQGTFSPYGSNWSNYLTSSSGYLRVGASANLAASTNSFTIEFWYLSSVNANGRPAGNGNNDTWGANKWIFANQLTGKLEFFVYNYSTGTAMFSSTSTTVAYDGQWHHIAITRSGNTWAMFIDGTRQGASVTSSVSLNGTSSTINVGWSYLTGDASAAFAGYISNFRFVNGSSVYDPTQSTITVPTGPLTAITNTAFLSCQNNRFVDNSTNAFAITPVGAASVQRFSPFSPSAAYSAATIGGSGYFDGTGDYLNAGSSTNLDNFTGDFCLEAWIYPTITSTTASQVPLARWTTGSRSYILYITATNNYIRIHYNNDTINLDSTTAVKINAWNHVVANRSGSTLTLFLNGTSVSTATSSATIVASTSTFIGATETASPQSFFNGYISDVRIVKGSSVYGTSNFTPPTAPLTAIANTQLLLSMQNAGVIDNAMMNDLETVGNAQISTTQSKFGGSSMYFDGTGDWLYGPSTPNVGFGTGPFTVEMWVYPTTNPANGPGTLFDARSGTLAEGWVIRIFSDLSVGFYDGPNNLYQQTAANAVSLNTWAYLAFVRSGTTLTIYVNGVSAKTATVSSNLGSSWPYYIGNNYSAGYTYYGYIDDLRITKGYARTITASPTAAFPTS